MNLRTLSILIAATIVGTAHADLLINGGFEAGAGESADGWSFVATATFSVRAVMANDYLGGGPTTGNYPGRVLDFNAADTPGGSTASQGFASSVGTLYALTLDYGQYNGAFGDQKLTAIVTDDVTSTTVASYAFPSPQPNTNLSTIFQTGGFAFVGTGNALTLTLTDAGSKTVSTDLFVDNVSIVAQPVPEPASLAVLGLGALARLRRRRQG